MQSSDKLLAWVVPHGDDFVAAIVGAPVARRRAPATHLCSSRPAAVEWVEEESAAVGLPVEWVDGVPRR
jgi:hypothetical protein